MFDSLKKKLKESAKKLADKVSKEEKAEEKPRKKPDAKPKEKKVPGKPRAKPAEPAAKRVTEEAKKPEADEPRGSIKSRLFGKVLEKRISGDEIDRFIQEIETDLLQANVALEVIDAFRDNLKKELEKKQITRGKAGKAIQEAFEEALMGIVNQDRIDLEKMAREKKPLTVVFLGVNGSGKTTSIAKVARWMIDRGLKPVLAAGDTFRAASIEQLEHHGKKLGTEVIKHQYGSDSAAVMFDAVKHAEARGMDAVLADTAGRSHSNTNLMDELKKVIRVNKPDLKILVADSLTGNDAVEQARSFNDAVGIDGIILTKIDVNKKGGSVLSVCWATKKPVLFFGTGQEYSDLVEFRAEEFVKELI